MFSMHFSDSEDGVWSWYLHHIRNGSFEELLHNKLKNKLLQRQIDIVFADSSSRSVNKKVLFISTSAHDCTDNLALLILESFLMDQFHLVDHLDYVQIKKLTDTNTMDQTPSDEVHYILNDTLQNFNAESFVQESPITRDTIEADGSSSMLVITQKDGKGEEKVQQLEDDGDDDGDDDIVINFKPKTLRGPDDNTHIPENSIPNLVYTPPVSENVSINSSTTNPNYEASYHGAPLQLVAANVATSSSVISPSTATTTSSSASSITSNNSICTMSSYMSILPCISICSRSLGNSRFVLQSILFYNPSTKQHFTAIRQSNNAASTADIGDDWLLYDPYFSMSNLQMLSLQNLLDINYSLDKILFYSMIIINKPAAFQGSTIRPDDEDDELEYDDEYGEDELQEYDLPQTYTIPVSKFESNATMTNQRSLRTINSVGGDWTLEQINTITNSTTKVDASETDEVASQPSSALQRSKSASLPVLLKTITNLSDHSNWKWKLHPTRSNSKGKSLRERSNSKIGKSCAIM